MSIGYLRFNPNPVDAGSSTLFSANIVQTDMTWAQVAELTWAEMLVTKTW